MTVAVPEAETGWLQRFFAAPNELSWDVIVAGDAPPHLLERVGPWLARAAAATDAPVLLPFVRAGAITGWYAAARGSPDLADDLRAWLGSIDLRVFEQVPNSSADPMAAALRAHFGGQVYRFGGASAAANATIADRVAAFDALLRRRPARIKRVVRPIGAIRAEFERALLAGDGQQAEALAHELRQTGRLNEENLRYVDVRLKAGLGFWPQIARDHWLLTTLADLALPPRVLADLIEALYRTYVEAAERDDDPAAMLAAFDEFVGRRYPRLFASRRGVRTPRVVKSFLLFEALQPRPNPRIIADLVALLPETERAGPWDQRREGPAVAAAMPEEAEAAFDDGQFDRALELFLEVPLTKRGIARLVFCAASIGTAEAAARVVARADMADARLVADLAPALRSNIDKLRAAASAGAHDQPPDGWLSWVERLAAGLDILGVEAAVRDGATTWDVRPLVDDPKLAQRFADLLGNLDGPAGEVARRGFPQVYAAFLADRADDDRGLKPIAQVLFLLLAMDDVLSATDLALLSQLVTRLLALGLSEEEYLSLVRDLGDVQARVSSYSLLPWSLDVCEALAIAPSPSEPTRQARLGLFMSVIAQAQSFAHRLQPTDLLLLEFLARDYGLDSEALSVLRRTSDHEVVAEGLRLEGKRIGIYTLAEAAGARAKQILEAAFPGCSVEVNSDLVCTARLSSLAKAADLFVFAWKSSSHQAFYCVKDAMPAGEPVWAGGKGTASILRAVYQALS